MSWKTYKNLPSWGSGLLAKSSDCCDELGPGMGRGEEKVVGGRRRGRRRTRGCCCKPRVSMAEGCEALDLTPRPARASHPALATPVSETGGILVLQPAGSCQVQVV